MAATFQLRAGSEFDLGTWRSRGARGWLDAVRDGFDRRAARRDLARLPAHLLADIGIDPQRIDEVVDDLIARRRVLRAGA